MVDLRMPNSFRFITTNQAQWGGSETLWQHAAMRLAGDGHRVFAQVPGTHAEHDSLKPLRESGITFTYNPPKPKKEETQKPPTLIKRAFRKIQRTLQGHYAPQEQLLEPVDLNVITFGSLSGSIGALRDLQASGHRCLVVVQLVAEYQHPRDPAAKLVAEQFSKAAAVYFVSENNIRLAESQVGRIPNAKVVRNPFLVPFEGDLPYPEPSPTFRVGSVARMHTFHKGFDFLMHVLAQEKWKSRDIEFHLFGDGPNIESLKRLSLDCGVQDRVFFRGHTNDIASVWRDCHASILCSRQEGLALSMVEAMLSSRVPIVTDVGGARELITDNVNGFIARYANVDEIDEAMERAWQRREEWREMGLLAAKTARETLPADPGQTFAELLLEHCSAAAL